MSSMNGLSSNTTNGQSRNALQLDSSARDSILAKNQARVLSALGITKKDEFSGGGGMNPLKGLYSAAAATFLKNKQSKQSVDSDKGMGSYEKAADILKSLSKKDESGSSGTSWQNTNSKVSGPAAGGNYKKYQWNGNGPTGSDVITEGTETDETPASEESQAPADVTPVLEAFGQVVTDGGGKFNDLGDGVYEFSVLDIVGTVKKQDGKLVGSMTGESGSYTFEIAADGSVMLDTSKGNTASEEFDQLKHLLGGDLTGARRKPTGVAEPEDDGSSSSSGTSGSGSSSSGSSSVDDSQNVANVLTNSTSNLETLANSGRASDRGRYNAKLLIDDIKAAGGTVTKKDDGTLNIAFNGQSGTLTMKDDKINVTLGSGSSQLSMHVHGNGYVSIQGRDANAAYRSSSVAMRRAIGVSTFGDPDFNARVVKFNRNGTGGGLNLLNLLG